MGPLCGLRLGQNDALTLNNNNNANQSMGIFRVKNKGCEEANMRISISFPKYKKDETGAGKV